MEYSMLDEQDRLLGYRISAVAPKEAQGNSTPGADPNIESFRRA